jgi:predicted lysophospholipase L1 biosynthesis ABC-type transport system permease subunit
MHTVAERDEPLVFWDQVASHLRTLPGVTNVAMAGWPLLDNAGWNGFVSVNGAPPGPILAYYLAISPGWLDTMKLPILDGRDFRADEIAPGAAIVNETFVRLFFNGANPIGQSIAKTGEAGAKVVAVVRDAPYRSIREPSLPSVYVPIRRVDDHGVVQPMRGSTFILRTPAANPMALASILRREVPRARPEFRVSTIRTQAELVRAQTLRERLLAMLGVFFAAVALLLAAIGLYGVLDYSVLQRRREIGIRMAIGAPARHIARLVTFEIFTMVLAGALAGLALGIASVRYVEAMLYQVKAGDPAMLAFPAVTILAAALLAALPAVWRAVRIDPVAMLRAD